MAVIGACAWFACFVGDNEPKPDLPPTTAQELADECFSGWDGNHDEVERLVAAGLNDPSSIDVHGTYFSDLDAPWPTARSTSRWTTRLRTPLDCDIIEVTGYGYEGAGTKH